ncbi:MAG: TolC family protein [Acidobacteriota bacterium]|jgi:outer membrane protein TolC
MTPIRTLLRSRPTPIGRAVLAVLIAGIGLFGVAADGARALELDLEPTALDRLPDPGVQVDEEGIHLSLDQAITVALRRNLGLVIERYNWIQSHHGVLQNLGIYDLQLTGGLNYRDTTQPTVAAVEGVPVTQETAESYQLGLTQLVPTGGTLELTTFGFTQDTNSRNVFLNPFYQAGTDLTYTQPLLRNFGTLPTERNILVARAQQTQSMEIVEQQVATTIQEVEIAYWDLVEARNQLVVAQEALRLAQTLHEQNRIRVEVGTLAPLELVQSEAGIAGREEDIIRAEAAIGDAADRLRQLLNLDEGRLWELPIVPETDPESERISVDVNEAIQTALQERPEIASELARIETLEIDTEYFRDQILPQIDLVLNYNLSGLSGDVDEMVDPVTGEITPAQMGGFGDSYEQILDRDFDEWSVQLQFSYPLQNRQRREQKIIADLALEQGLAGLEQLRKQIITEVRTTARGVETAAKQIESARVSRRLEERNLEAERKRYENGMSSSFRVLQIQEDLTQARSREVTAVTTYRTALARYYRAIGRLLEQKGVEIDGGSVAEGRRFGLGGLFRSGA